MNYLLATMKEALSFAVLRPSLLVALCLVFLLPLIFLYSGQTFLDAGRANQEKLQRDRVGMLHDSLTILIRTETDFSLLSTVFSQLKDQNQDIERLFVLTVSDEGLLISSASDEDLVGSTFDQENLINFSSIQSNETLLFTDNSAGYRRWIGVRSIIIGDKRLILYSESNLSFADAYLASAEQRAYEGLIFVLLLALVLAWWQVKQVNYKLRYQQTKMMLNSRDVFTNMLVHELRTPLTAILGYASLIRESSRVEPETVSKATVVEDSARKLLLLVNDLLDVARIQSGKLKVASEAVAISDVVSEVVTQLKPLAVEHSLSLVERSEEGLIIQGDKARLRQILVNLISNALKYTQVGGVTIVTTKQGMNAEIRIADTGMGIKAQDQQKLFAPFFRVEGSETESITGTGLGMWITKELISQMKATIAVESIKGVGTHVVIILPLVTK